MATLARRRFDDDDDLYDDEGNGPYDKRYPGQRVIADRGKVSVPIMLTDSMPPAYRAAISRRPALYDASAHRPHFAVVDASDPHVKAAERAYHDRSKWLQDAWRNPSGQMQQPPDNSDPDGDEDDGETLSPRDEYIRRTSNMWRTPMASPYAEANAVQAAYIRTAGGGPGPPVPGGEAEMIEAARRGRRPGTPGVTYGAHNPAKFPSWDAASLKDARADADQAHAEMVHRLENAWRR
jgi:hypothetical protein